MIRRVGLLGGSFNPAHEGHLHISRIALKRLALHAVWWMVSPQNPLKATEGMADFSARISAARGAARDPRIEVTGIEAELGTVYTLETVTALQARFASTRFVWLMGADNLVQIRRWKRWPRLFERLPIAVFPRPSYSRRALRGAAAQRFATGRIPLSKLRALADLDPPAWAFVQGPVHSASATAIRAQRNGARLQTAC